MLSINIEAFWVSLLGFWLSYSLATFGVCCTRLHWFLKFLAIAGLAGVLLFIEAPDLMLMVLAQCLTIFLMLAVGKVWSNRRGNLSESNNDKTPNSLRQIGLLDMLLAMAVLPILLAAVQVDLSDHLPLFHSVAFGASLGFVSVLAFWLTKVNRWWVGIVIAIGCVAGAVAIPKIIFRPPPTDFGEAVEYYASFGRFAIWGELSDFAFNILIANSIAIVLLGLSWRLSRSNRVWIKRVAQTAGALMIAAMILMSTGTVHLYSCLLNGPRVVWPDQKGEQINGFDELVAAGRRFDKSRLLIFPKIAATRAGKALQQELDAYSSEFEQAESALKRPFLTSAVSSIDEYDSFSRDYNHFRRVALALDCRAIQHLHEGDYDSALNDACLIAELSVPMRRGNTMSSVLAAGGIEQMGHHQAAKVVQVASSESLKLAMSRLARIEPADQRLDDVYENDIALEWASAQYWQRRLEILIREAEMDDHCDFGMLEHTRYGDSIRRQTIILMAIELFRRKEKRYPANLKSLVPEFLESVPIDPFSSKATEQPFIYQRSKDGGSFELYSVGTDLIDNHGKIGQDGRTLIGVKGDINLAARIKYDEATTDAEREELTMPDPHDKR